ncbi:MAG: secretin N-terminal domain-containing protein [Candidatus Omnitrophota bacterium]
MRRNLLLFLLSLIFLFVPLALSMAQEFELFDLRDTAEESPYENEGGSPFDEPKALEETVANMGQEDELEGEPFVEVLPQEEEKELKVVGDQTPAPDVSSQEEQTDLISINFENVDIRDVMRILANKAQINMVMSPDISANVNIQLNNVSWEQALNVILSTYGLTYREEDGLIRIMTRDQFQIEQEKVPLTTKIIVMNFARASEIQGNFKNMLSSRGKIDVNARTNSLIITDIPDVIAEIEEVSQLLDLRTPQVMIETLVADVKITQDDQLGVDWDVFWPDTSTGSKQREFNITPGLPGSSIFDFKFGTTILTDKDLSAIIQAMQSQSRVNILAHPKILTLDNLAATVSLTEEIPYQQQTESTQGGAVVSTSFKTAGIDINVTPQITKKDNYIYLKLSVNQSFRGQDTADGQPTIDSRAASTNLLVKNGNTAVIAGLRRKNNTFSIFKVPLLGDIPMFGSLFRKRSESLVETDLMIFVTPRVIEEQPLTGKERDRLELFDEETEDWSGQFNISKKRKLKAKKAQQKQEPIIQYQIQEWNPEETIYLRPPALNEESP